jgi:hypothetical protein
VEKTKILIGEEAQNLSATMISKGSLCRVSGSTHLGAHRQGTITNELQSANSPDGIQRCVGVIPVIWHPCDVDPNLLHGTGHFHYQLSWYKFRGVVLIRKCLQFFGLFSHKKKEAVFIKTHDKRNVWNIALICPTKSTNTEKIQHQRKVICKSIIIQSVNINSLYNMQQMVLARYLRCCPGHAHAEVVG